MASRMNSGGFKDLKRIKIDPQTGEKFNFNVDKVAAKFSFNVDIVAARKRANFKDNLMASRMNSGGSNDLNCIRTDPRTGKKFSFNVDIVAAMAWQHPQQYPFIHARSFSHCLLLYCTLRHCRPMKWVIT